MLPTGSQLASHLEVFEDSLRKRGYRPGAVRQYVGKCRTFDAFLIQRGLGLASLTASFIEEFLADKLPRRKHRDEETARRSWRRPLHLLLEHLRSNGAIPRMPMPAPSEHPLLREYASFLNDHRGVCKQTAEHHVRTLKRFLHHIGATHAADLGPQISPQRIDGFLVDLSRRLGRQSINSACAALRGFLRFLHMRGLVRASLAEQVARPRIYTLATLPMAIDWPDVERTLALVDLTTLTGRRDYAILVLLAYCGLRAGEVAALRLEDIDWAHDRIRLHRRKSKTIDHLPLVPLVGESLIEYLRRRPAAPFPQLFLKVLAPAGPMSGSCVTMMARKYLLQADVKLQRLGAHTFRHSFAVRLLRQGFPLKTIGDALGHGNPQSTFIYTKAATEDLRSVCLEISEVLP